MSPLLMILIAVCVVGVFYLTKKENDLRTQSRHWPSVEGTVSSSKVSRQWDKNTGAPKTTYSFELQYNYEVDGVDYVGRRYAFHGNPSFSSRSEAEKLAESFPTGQTVEVYYSSESPQESVLIKD